MANIGYEVEFCHDLDRKAIIKELKSLFPKEKWCSYKQRYLSRMKEDAKYMFTLDYDWSIDVDFDNQHPYEIITPVWPKTTSVLNLMKILEWIEDSGGTTNKTTSLHVNIDVPLMNKIDPISLVELVKEYKWLRKFKRINNIFCLPNYKNLPDIDLEEKFLAISFRNFPKYLEFRMIGGKDYHLRNLDIIDAINAFVEAILKSRR